MENLIENTILMSKIMYYKNEILEIMYKNEYHIRFIKSNSFDCCLAVLQNKVSKHITIVFRGTYNLKQLQ